jgi:hypothetical protein
MKLIGFALLTVFLASCGGSTAMKQQDMGSDMEKVVEPSWFRTETEDVDNFFVYGEGESRDKNTSYDEAKANASGEMAQILEQNIDNMLTNMRDRAGTGDNEQILKTTSNVFRSTTSKVVTGLQVVKSEAYKRKSDGKYVYYVMMKLPKKPIKDNYTQALKNEEALYSQFREKQLLQQMENEIDKLGKKKN